MESSKVCIDTVHVSCEDTGELHYKPCFPGKVESKSRLIFCLAELVLFMWLPYLMIPKRHVNWKLWSVISKQSWGGATGTAA